MILLLGLLILGGSIVWADAVKASVPAGPVSVADVNGDGKPDLANQFIDNAILLGNGDGTFQAPQSFSSGN